MNERRLFVPGYYSGFSNNRMSLDIAVVLAHLSGRVLVPYHFRIPRRAEQPINPGHLLKPLALVPELFEIPVAWSDEYLQDNQPPMPGAVSCEWESVCESVFYTPADAPIDDTRFAEFCNGREHAYTFDARQSEAGDLHVRSKTLGFYSYFFYLDDAQRTEVIGLMRRLQPKAPYRALAERIAASLGRFNAIHLRRGDFVSSGFTPRAADVSGREIVANLATRMDREVPLVVCTDGSARDELFAPLQRHFRHTIFLDPYLEGDPGFRRALVELPFNDEVVVALLNQLVASQAEIFAGTLFSTFTALIHRLRGFAGREPNFLYCYNDFASPFVRFEGCEFLPVDEGPFSWNRTRYPVAPHAYSWFREWPEAFAATLPQEASGAVSQAVVQLPAREAVIHGAPARYMDDEAGEGMIGYWTNAADFVAWQLSMATAGTYWVEIRYACPADSAGSRYRVGIDDGEAVEARVWNTGGWRARTPWLLLGQLRIPAGSATLALHVIDKPGFAVMNLSAVRLLPIDNA